MLSSHGTIVIYSFGFAIFTFVVVAPKKRMQLRYYAACFTTVICGILYGYMQLVMIPSDKDPGHLQA